MPDLVFDYQTSKMSTAIIMLGFSKKVEEPYRVVKVHEKDNPHYELQKKGRFLLNNIGKLESPDDATLKLTFKKQVAQQNIDYFKNLLEKLIKIEEQEDNNTKSGVSKYTPK